MIANRQSTIEPIDSRLQDKPEPRLGISVKQTAKHSRFSDVCRSYELLVAEAKAYKAV
jgi:hypothetical protein